MHTLETSPQARTLARFLAELSPRTHVRAAAGTLGAWRNTYPDTMALAEVNPLRPVAMYLTRRRRGAYRFTLLPLDCDAKRVPAAQAAADAELLAAAARTEGIEPVPAQSGPDGGRHVWLGCAEGVPAATVQRIAQAARALCPSVDVAPLLNPRTGAVRPPGAAHRHGGHSRLTAHTVDQAVKALGPASARAEAFERLAVRLESMAADLPAQQPATPTDDDTAVPPSIRHRGPVVRPVVTDAAGCPKLAVPWRPLGERAIRGLRRKLTARHDHSAQAHAPARSMALAGWTQAEGLAVVRDAESSPALEWLRSQRQPDGTRTPRTDEETARLWARVWWLAVQDAARMPRRPEDDGGRHERTDVERAVVDLFARMRAAGPARWGRESGPADAAVLAALAWLMLTAGTTDVSANVRRLGVLAGYSHQTAALALWRLIRDGWLTVTAEADRKAGKARRVTLATAHECPEHDGHRCAVYHLPDDVSPSHPGSDRRRNAAAPPAPSVLSPGTPAHVRTLLIHHQADVWHSLGHHAARTLQAVRELHRPTLADLMAATGYGRRATLRHLQQLQALQLATTSRPRRGRNTYAPTGRPLYEAAQETRTAGRIARLAVEARVDQAAHEWWAAEEEWSALPRAEKRGRGRRPGPDQQVIPGMAPGVRAYPRHPNGRPDHRRARRIEAERIGAAGMLAHAQQLAETGELIDPAHLSATGAQQPEKHGRRQVFPARYPCPLCQAAPGDPCVTWRGEAAARWHAARRAAAEKGTEAPTRGEGRASA
ncbi:zinc finger domain-containing protein [Streptomyces atacamensis]|uniref:zinc finger domain-containing protein n=1 Tax=Streptomyces atacamensis TaxID=531966 RepID=UPI00399D0222